MNTGRELNIKRIAKEKNINNRAMAKAIGSNRPGTICDKLNCKREVTMSEAFSIRNAFFPEYTLEELFSVRKEV